jgi:hypothetical protein
MRTDDLIGALAADVPPTPRSAVARRLALGLFGGGVIAFAALLASLGLRPDLAQALGGYPFWMKWAFTIAMVFAGFGLAIRLARPDGRVGWLAWAAVAPVGVLLVPALLELARTPVDSRLALLLGSSAALCPWRILALAVPVYLGLLWAFRRLAPTRLVQAGFGAGLAAGAASATIYALYCQESAATFVVVWYTLGIVGAGMIGAMTGPRLLRW